MKIIKTLKEKNINYDLYDKKVLKHIENNRFSTIMNSYSINMNKSYALYLFYWITKNTNKNVVIVSNSIYCYENIIEYLKTYCDKFHIKYEQQSNKKYIFGTNKIMFLTLHKNSFAGIRIDLLLCINFSFCINSVVENFYKKVFPCINADKNSQIILGFNPNGNNWVYKLFQDAESGKNQYKALRLYYWENGEYDGEKVSELINKYGIDIFNKEYNMCF